MSRGLGEQVGASTELGVDPSDAKSDLGASVARGTIAREHGRRDYILRRALALADSVALIVAGLVALSVSPAYLRGGPLDVLWLLPTIPVWLVLFRTYGLYERDVKRIGHNLLEDLPSLFHVFLLGTLGLWMYFRFIDANQLIYVEALVFGIGGIVLVTLFRSAARLLVSCTFGPERVLLIGASPLIAPLVRNMRAHRHYQLRPVGIVLMNRLPLEVPSLPVLGRARDVDIPAVLEEHDIERVIVAHDDVGDDVLMGVIQACGRLHIKVGLLPRDLDALGPSSQIDDVQGLTVLGLNPLVFSRSSRFVKRLMDVIGASLALILAAPITAGVVLAIKLDTRGPVFFRQPRVGRLGRRFTLLKFRTMIRDAELWVDQLSAQSQDPNWLQLEEDPRVTRVGRFLRLTSLDELPQLFNVLRGDMSLVGPRPLIPSEDDQISGWARTRLELAPGITGLWQVLGRTSIPFEEMVKLDCVYVTNWSAWLDLKLMARTIPAVIMRRGAN